MWDVGVGFVRLYHIHHIAYPLICCDMIWCDGQWKGCGTGWCGVERNGYGLEWCGMMVNGKDVEWFGVPNPYRPANRATTSSAAVAATQPSPPFAQKNSVRIFRYIRYKRQRQTKARSDRRKKKRDRQRFFCRLSRFVCCLFCADCENEIQ